MPAPDPPTFGGRERRGARRGPRDVGSSGRQALLARRRPDRNGAGVGAAALTFVLTTVQHWVWPPANLDLLQAASGAGFWRHVIILTGAGIVTGIGQICS